MEALRLVTLQAPERPVSPHRPVPRACYTSPPHAGRRRYVQGEKTLNLAPNPPHPPPLYRTGLLGQPAAAL